VTLNNKKIMYIPLDERPCNAVYPSMLYGVSGEKLISFPKESMGFKKNPTDINKIDSWIKENIAECSHLVLSCEMFFYGGLVPSRIHNFSIDNMKERVDILKSLKKEYPGLKIFAYNLIMRSPNYNSDEEEPCYYAEYGSKISEIGKLKDRILRGEIEKDIIERKVKEIPKDFLEDYEGRRAVNSFVNGEMVKMAKDRVIDFLVFPMDDCSPYGYSAMERRSITEKISELALYNKILVYPGADEVGSVLVSRAFNEIKNYKPKIYLKYASEIGKNTVPLLEDRSLHESVKYQVIASGGIVIEDNGECDYMLYINPPTNNTRKYFDGWDSLIYRKNIIDPERNLNEFVESIAYYTEKKLYAVADVACVNGSDGVLMELMSSYNLLNSLIAYGGWNTSSNTLGVVIAQANINSYYINNNEWDDSKKKKAKQFLFLRYLEDWGYQHIARGITAKKIQELGIDYFKVFEKEVEVVSIIEQELKDFRSKKLNDFNLDFSVYLPWHRLYEVGINIKDKLPNYSKE
jgi:hypothetical protein